MEKMRKIDYLDGVAVGVLLEEGGMERIAPTNQ